MKSAAQEFLERLLAYPGEDAHIVLDAILDELPPDELAALNFDWEFWARANQILPKTSWRSCLIRCGRAWGKTITAVKYALDRIENDPSVEHVGLIGPTDDQVVALYVTGASGFLKNTPPWLGVEYQKADQRLLFGNGVVASLYSAQVPSRLNGPQHQLMLCTELAFWPAATREKAFSNVQLSTRTGAGQYVVDTTPQDDDPLLDQMHAEHEADPAKHLLIEGRTDENELNLSEGIVAEWRNTFKGSDTEATDLDGDYRNEPPNRVLKRSSVERSLRGGLLRYERRIVTVDPSTAGKKYSDAIGIIETGLAGGNVYTLRNLGGKLDIEEWPEMLLDVYRDERIDLLAIECDHASTAWPKIFGDGCKLRGWHFNRIDEESQATARHVPGQLNFYGFRVGNKQSKLERVRAAAAWLDRGRVSFVRGALGNLEKQMYSFTGADNRPDDAVDAWASGVMLLLGNTDGMPAMRPGDGEVLLALQKAISSPGASPLLNSNRSIVHNGVRMAYDGSSSMRDFTSGGGDRIGR